LLFRNQPALAAELIRGALGGTLPLFSEVRQVSADLSDVQPAEYRADMVLELWTDTPVFVLGPAGVPRMTDDERARANPELAVLSAMAHGRDENPERAVEIALAALKASGGLDADRADMYGDLIFNSLSEAARKALTPMPAHKYEFQVPPEERAQLAARLLELAEIPQPLRALVIREAVARVRAEEQGEVRGRVALLIRLLNAKFGHIESQVNERIQRASIDELDAIGERLLTARTLQDALGA
jgi:hypothetical protein